MLKNISQKINQKYKEQLLKKQLRKNFSEKKSEEKNIALLTLELLKDKQFKNHSQKLPILNLICNNTDFFKSLYMKKLILNNPTDPELLEKIQIIKKASGFMSTNQLTQFLIEDNNFYQLCLANIQKLPILINLLDKKYIITHQNSKEIVKRILTAPTLQKSICISDYLLYHSQGNKDINMIKMITGYKNPTKLKSIHFLSYNNKPGLLETDLKEIAIDTMKYFKLYKDDRTPKTIDTLFGNLEYNFNQEEITFTPTNSILAVFFGNVDKNSNITSFHHKKNNPPNSTIIKLPSNINYIIFINNKDQQVIWKKDLLSEENFINHFNSISPYQLTNYIFTTQNEIIFKEYLYDSQGNQLYHSNGSKLFSCLELYEENDSIIKTLGKEKIHQKK